MTMNVATGALAMMLCLTVTSSQQGFGKKESIEPDTRISFTTETKNDVSFERNNINLVTLYEDATETVTEEITEEIVEEVEEVEEIIEEVIEEVVVEEESENRWGIELTQEEIDLLAKILWVEARGESATGQEAVVEVVFNRIVSEEFPNVLSEVLSQKKPVQFASWKSRNTAKPTEKEYASIYAVLEGKTDILKEETVYFATKKLTRNLDIQIGGHYFCY